MASIRSEVDDVGIRGIDEDLWSPGLKRALTLAQHGLAAGLDPLRAEEGESSTYFFRTTAEAVAAVDGVPIDSLHRDDRLRQDEDGNFVREGQGYASALNPP